MSGTLAIIPARAGSKRLPNKNHRQFLGQPLIRWTIDFALSLSDVSCVLVTTDSDEVASIARAAGAYVPWMRPSELALDTAKSIDVVMHAVHAMIGEGIAFDAVALLQPTSPIRKKERWQEAMELIKKGSPAAVAVSPASSHPYWTYLIESDRTLKPCFAEGLHMRSQDLPTACVPNGSLYLCRKEILLQQNTLTPEGVAGVMCSDPIESIDIDTEADWILAEKLVSEKMSYLYE